MKVVLVFFIVGCVVIVDLVKLKWFIWFMICMLNGVVILLFLW